MHADKANTTGASIVAKPRARDPRELAEPALMRIRSALKDDPAALSDLDFLWQLHQDIVSQAQIWSHTQKYNRDMIELLGVPCAAPNYFFHSSWSYGNPWGDLHNAKLLDVFVPFEESLIEELHACQVPGAIIEFGIYQGHMLYRLIAKMESIGMARDVYGFDSFEGLSQPSAEHDFGAWEKGQYAAPYEIAAANLRLSERPFLKLIKGWLAESLKTPEALAVDQVAYARIDVDVYEPTVDCLAYLSDRLAHGAILAFDDWSYSSDKGESKAFIDWAPTVPKYKFEWLGQCSSRFYLRVLHRNSEP